MVHGGLFWENITLADIQEEDRYHQIPPVDSYMEQMLWSDPREQDGRADNPRGASLVFGGDVVREFLSTNGLELIVRSHEVLSTWQHLHGLRALDHSACRTAIRRCSTIR